MKGICFIEPLHEKTVKGIKTQTRRIIPEQFKWSDFRLLAVSSGEITAICPYEDGITYENRRKYPRYNVGEIIYLKEPYIIYQTIDYIIHPDGRGFSEVSDGLVGYKYDGHDTIEDFKKHIRLMSELGFEGIECNSDKWSNKLFMSQKYARHYIKITGVRAERLQDISDEDCLKEGVEPMFIGYCADVMIFDTPREAYADLIDSINGKGTWESNPYVWVYDYKLTEY